MYQSDQYFEVACQKIPDLSEFRELYDWLFKVRMWLASVLEYCGTVARDHVELSSCGLASVSKPLQVSASQNDEGPVY